MEKPLVSLIVPVYNVEGYLKECLDSVLEQTYQNLEIVLVNDGSTDGSLAICEKYLKSDRRIKLISKKNGGLASARNRGIQESKGEYIGFIDSDDRIHNKFVEVLMRAILFNGCDIATSDYTNRLNKLKYTKNSSVILEKTDAISGLLDDGGYKCFACNKLFKKIFFSDISFPEGELFEDIIPMYKLFKKSKKIAYIKCPLYYYRPRKGSISRSKFTKGNYHLIKSIDYLVGDALKNPANDRDRLMLGYMSYFMGFVRRGLLAEADIENEVTRLRRLIIHNRKKICRKRTNLRTVKKIEMILFAYYKWIYTNMLYLYKDLYKV